MEEKLKSKIIAEQWEKGSDTNKARLRRYRMIVETFAFNCMEALEKEVFNPKLSQIEKELKEKDKVIKELNEQNKRLLKRLGYPSDVRIIRLNKPNNKGGR